MDDPLRLQEKLFIIDQLPVFAGLSQKDKKAVAAVSAIAEYKKDTAIYREGEAADAFYCVITGRLRVYITRPSGKEDLEYLKRGRFFGIISILTSEPHSATVETVNDSILLKIPKKDFDKMLKRLPVLAIRLGETLSRRLKRKDIHEKRVFESTIISVFGTPDKVGATHYAVNLAVSLRSQTNKKVILLDISREGTEISDLLGIKDGVRPLGLDSPFFNESSVIRSIARHPLGIDILNIPYRTDDDGDVTHIVPLLSYLTNDYHYVVADLPTHMGRTTFESLKQSDIIHIITASDEPSLISTKKMIDELTKSSAEMAQRIKVIVNEFGAPGEVGFDEKTKMLKHGIYATLPPVDDAMRRKALKAGSPLSSAFPECEYSRAVRRISREVGGCLVGLALGCGAALGLAHIGVLRVIERERIPVDMLSGTSVGAFMGALWASGKDSFEMEKIMMEFKHKIKALRLIDPVFPVKGIIKGAELRKFFHAHLGDMTFYDLRLPFKIATCDIETREEVVLEKGSVVDAISASVAIPGVFEPVMIAGRPLVDGGIINPLPTSVLARAGVTKIIAVNTLPSPQDIQRSKKKVTSIFDVIVNSIQASEYLLAEMSSETADIAIHPVLPAVEWYEIYEGTRIIKSGEEEASKYISRMKELIAS
ncbi:MAG: patatin-like phospholipase family protein [Candidatus Omnitrophota bacterium]